MAPFIVGSYKLLSNIKYTIYILRLFDFLRQIASPKQSITRNPDGIKA